LPLALRTTLELAVVGQLFAIFAAFGALNGWTICAVLLAVLLLARRRRGEGGAKRRVRGADEKRWLRHRPAKSRPPQGDRSLCGGGLLARRKRRRSRRFFVSIFRAEGAEGG